MTNIAPAPDAKKKRGCLFYAGIAAGLLFLGGLAAAVALGGAAKRAIKAYTAADAAPLPAWTPPPGGFPGLEERVKIFKDALRSSQASAPLELSGDELNALIAREPVLKPLEGRLRVAIEGDRLEIRVSAPLEGSGIPFTGGRHFNGSTVLKISLDAGVFVVTADSVTVNGAPLPESVMSRLRNENLARDVYRRPQTAEVLRRIDSIRVKDGKLSVALRPKAAEKDSR